MKFSIITPVYNREDCIERCIKSVLKQIPSLKDEWEYEHIIVNDGSIDGSDTIIKEYSKEYSNIIYIPFVKNRGTNAARNAAIKKASGNFCIILDSDDYFVDNALNIIYSVIQRKPGYKHYMFAPDDRKEFFDKNELLKDEQIITFQDFLSQKHEGDFIHVIDTDTMQKYPFDESLRIYEGVFFLSFYKEAQNICFTNIVTTIRERGREDSVSKEYIRTSITSIKNTIKASEIILEVFQKDYIEYGLQKSLNAICVQLLDNYLLLGDYKRSKAMLKMLKKKNITISKPHQIIYYMRLGNIYRILLYLFLKTKYFLVKVK